MSDKSIRTVAEVIALNIAWLEDKSAQESIVGDIEQMLRDNLPSEPQAVTCQCATKVEAARDTYQREAASVAGGIARQICDARTGAARKILADLLLPAPPLAGEGDANVK